MVHEETVYEALSNAHGDEGHWAFGTGFDEPLAGVDTTVPDGVDPTDLGAYCLMLGDDALVLAQRLTQWITHAPELEEEVAIGNIGLDLLGQARLLLARAGTVGVLGRSRDLATDSIPDEDALAYFRDADEFRNTALVEAPNGDFARTIVRQFLYSAFADPYWRAMMRSADPTLAAIAAKSEKESAYHLRHSAEWVIRLGDGTDESHRRAQEAVDDLWPYTREMFDADEAERVLIEADVAVDPEGLRGSWERRVADVLAEATLSIPASGWMQSGGRSGRHSEHLGHLLAEMQFLQRAYPGATW